MRRVLFGIFWFGILWVALMVVGGGIAGSMTAGPAGKPGENFREGSGHGTGAGDAASGEFAEKYGTHVLFAAAALAALGTIAGKLPGTRPQR